jgi:hypothetical protein
MTINNLFKVNFTRHTVTTLYIYYIIPHILCVFNRYAFHAKPPYFTKGSTR